MDTNEALKQLNNKEFLNMIYGFSYQRCNTAQEAEDLCSEIILAVIAAIRRQEHIGSFHAFVWTVARRAYADYCRRRSSEHRTAAAENCTLQAPALLHDDAIESYIEAEAEREQLSMIYREIAFLSKAYRDVMVMHYLDGLGVKDIAARIGISETAVKQRLFSARNTVRKEVKSMSERKYVLKPVSLRFIGTGDPIGNAPQKKAERSGGKLMTDVARGSSPEFPYTETRMKIESFYHSKEDEYLRELRRREAEFDLMVMEAENWLKDIQDPQLYGIFRRKMKDNMTDSQIAEELGYSRSRITQIINKYLQPDKD